MRLRAAIQADAALLWGWANDPVARASAFCSAAIPWPEHLRWLEEKLADPDTMILIGEEPSGCPVGQIRFDRIETGEAQIDLSVDPASRGMGFGARLLRAGMETVLKSTAVRRLHAHIRPENAASLALFERAGFTRAGIETVRGVAAVHYVQARQHE